MLLLDNNYTDSKFIKNKSMLRNLVNKYVTSGTENKGI